MAQQHPLTRDAPGRRASEYIRYRPHTTGSGGVDYQPILIKCPACGEVFGSSPGEGRTAHIASHSPEDFNLTPLRTDG